MLEFVITVIIILTILTLLMFLLLKKIVHDVNNQTKEYFTLKLQDYDDLIDEREKALEELKQDNIYMQVEEKNKENKIVKDATYYNDKIINYQVDNILQQAKFIESKFCINDEEIIKEFINNNDIQESDLYKELISLKNKIYDLGIFNIIIKNNFDIKKVLNECSIKCQKLFAYYMLTNEKINITKFLEYLEIEILKNDPTIYIEVGNKNINYDYLNNQIKTIYNKKIYKGIKIYYRNRLYDYSLE